ncbi:MAG: radical SAM protein [Candidatus Omnitrophica bacterium]|nr:radical SAM protein [Candidatus Omnitrophota bacterium]MBU4478985.1 radical SAM protein [Candidatus Omnitrophota bacterium]
MEKVFPLRNALENVNRALRLIRVINFNSGRLLGPLSVEISLTSACNFNCYFCSSHSLLRGDRPPSESLSDSTIFELLEDIRLLKIPEIRFSGDGEPFIHNRFPEIIDMCKGRKIKIVTNGSRLNLVTTDLFSKIHKLTISLNSIDNETHRLIHGYKGPTQLPFIIENIERLLRPPQARRKLQINCAVGIYNLGELESLFQLSNRWNVFFAVHPVEAVIPGLESKILTPAQMRDARDRIAKMLREMSLSPNAAASLKYALFCFQSDEPYSQQKHLLPCYAGFYGAYLTANGDYRICCYCKSAMGNINVQRFAELWKDSEVQKTLYTASFMHQSNIAACTQCASCPEVLMYSRIFHKIFSKIIHRRPFSDIDAENIRMPKQGTLNDY